jgi:hypothetical protein
MEYLKKGWDWIMSHVAIIVLVLFFAVYFLVNLELQKRKSDISEADYACQSLCFPQQHEYLSVGSAKACWCYISPEELIKYKDTK